MNTSFRKISLTAAYLVLTTFLLAEIGVRLWGSSERHIYDPIYMPFERSDDIPYVHKPDLVNARARGLAIINTDSLGLRSPMAGRTYGPRQGGEYRIAIVGDSGTFGEGVPSTDDTYAQVLERALNQKNLALRTQVFNYGASAYSVKVMAAMLKHRMLEIDPDVVLMSINPDDLVLERTPDIDAAGYLSASGGVAGVALAQLPVLRNLRLLYAIREAWEGIAPAVEARKRLARGELLESYEYVRRFAEVASMHDTRYAIVLLPTASEAIVLPLREQLRRDRIHFVDLASLLDGMPREQRRASRFDGHPSAAAHHRIGEALAAAVLRTLMP